MCLIIQIVTGSCVYSRILAKVEERKIVRSRERKLERRQERKRRQYRVNGLLSHGLVNISCALILGLVCLLLCHIKGAEGPYLYFLSLLAKFQLSNSLSNGILVAFVLLNVEHVIGLYRLVKFALWGLLFTNVFTAYLLKMDYIGSATSVVEILVEKQHTGTILLANTIFLAIMVVLIVVGLLASLPSHDNKQLLWAAYSCGVVYFLVMGLVIITIFIQFCDYLALTAIFKSVAGNQLLFGLLTVSRRLYLVGTAFWAMYFIWVAFYSRQKLKVRWQRYWKHDDKPVDFWSYVIQFFMWLCLTLLFCYQIFKK